MASSRGLALTPFFQREFIAGTGGYDGFRIKIVASDGDEIPDAIFAYRMLPLQPGQAETIGFFSHVCSSVDLEQFPLGAPRVNATPPWFRLDFVDVVLRSRAEADEFYAAVVADVANLVESMDHEDKLDQLPPFRVGAADEVGSSESSEAA